MISARRPLLVLHPEAAFRTQIRTAAAKEHEISWLDSWSELVEAIPKAAPAAIAIVDPYLASGDRGTAPELRALLREFPSLTVVAAMKTGGDQYRDVRTLGMWGIAEVISLDVEATPEAVLRRLRSVRGHLVQSLLRRALPERLAYRPLSLSLVAAETASLGGGSVALAARLRVPRRTLYRWTVEAGLPPPRRLLVWMRILLAAELLDDPGRRVSGVAYVCGYSSDNALRTALSSLLGKTPTALRREGAFATASEAFLAELSERRSRLRER
jgi:AraC-like DNA-binding protein